MLIMTKLSNTSYLTTFLHGKETDYSFKKKKPYFDNRLPYKENHNDRADFNAVEFPKEKTMIQTFLEHDHDSIYIE